MGDYDNDGKLDIGITGAKDSIIIKYSSGGGTLDVSFNAVFTGVFKQEIEDSFRLSIGFDKPESYAISCFDWEIMTMMDILILQLQAFQD